MAEGQLGRLERPVGLAHRRHQLANDDRATVGRRPIHARSKPIGHRVDDRVEAEPTAGRQLGRIADLGVDHPVGRQVLGALGRDPRDRRRRLHDPDGVGERLEVELERLAVGAAPDPGGQLVRVGRRQPGVAGLGGELDDRPGTEAAVEVVVEQDLGCSPDRLEGDRHDGHPTRA